jgi:hypothetical protein
MRTGGSQRLTYSFIFTQARDLLVDLDVCLPLRLSKTDAFAQPSPPAA